MNDFLEIYNWFKANKSLNEEYAAKFINFISSPINNEIDIASLTAAWKAKGETSDDLYFIAQIVLEKLDRVYLQDDIIVDCCGTGGDRSNSFNISTVVAIILAGMGVKVVKHGGRRTTSLSGSVDFVEKLGIPIYTKSSDIRQVAEKHNLIFISSPALHNILGKWKSICSKLGFAGQTGLIGTLTNPVNITHQVLGVCREEWGELMIEALHKLGRKKAIVLFGEPHLDEASLCGKTKIWYLNNNKITNFTLIPEIDFDLPYCSLDDIKGGSPEQNVQIFQDLSQNKGNTGLMNTIILNSALALWLTKENQTINESIKEVKKFIISGSAFKSIDLLRNKD